MKNFFVVLGSLDPEMKKTESIIKDLGIQYVYATINDWRCNPGNVYRADPIKVPKGKRLVLVECEPKNSLDFPNLVRIDHHRPDIDSAANLGPEKYLEASSIGQLCNLLNLNITKEVRVIASSDHCFASAIQGLCPRVMPSDVVTFRVNEVMHNHGVSKSKINSLMGKFFKIITSAKVKIIGEQEVLDLRRFCFNRGYTSELLILQTVLAMKGKAALVCFSHYETGQQRVIITGYAYPETVQAFMVWAEGKGYKNIFGVKQRNYGGADH